MSDIYMNAKEAKLAVEDYWFKKQDELLKERRESNSYIYHSIKLSVERGKFNVTLSLNEEQIELLKFDGYSVITLVVYHDVVSNETLFKCLVSWDV